MMKASCVLEELLNCIAAPVPGVTVDILAKKSMVSASPF